MGRIDPVEFYAELRMEKDLAYLFFDGINEIWIPKSQVLNLEKVDSKTNDFEVTIPEWLAIKKGII